MNTERETILRKLAEFDYYTFTKCVYLDSSEIPILSQERINKTGQLPYITDTPWDFVFTISEINQAKEEVRADLEGINKTRLTPEWLKNKIEQDDEESSEAGLNDWYNRETIQANINSMFPDNGKPYQCRQMLVEGVLSNPCSCKKEFGTVEELKAHLIEKKVVADGHVPTTILNLFKKN